MIWGRGSTALYVVAVWFGCYCCVGACCYYYTRFFEIEQKLWWAQRLFRMRSYCSGGVCRCILYCAVHNNNSSVYVLQQTTTNWNLVDEFFDLQKNGQLLVCASSIDSLVFYFHDGFFSSLLDTYWTCAAAESGRISNKKFQPTTGTGSSCR